MTDAEVYGATTAGCVAIVTIAASLVTLIKNGASKEQVRPLSQDDAHNIRAVVDGIGASLTRREVENAEIKKDVQHILEKIERMEEQRERDHADVKKLSRILYPLLKEEIAAQRKKMGLSSDTDTGEMAAA